MDSITTDVDRFKLTFLGANATVTGSRHLLEAGGSQVLVDCGLCRLLLPDSGRLQEEEAGFAERKGSSRQHPAEPLYTEADALRSLRGHRIPRSTHHLQRRHRPATGSSHVAALAAAGE